ncbi:transcription factor Opi1 [Piedraia hortae CBS 480.64]|uniref:Transcription factor Opi1 n=1 Tax=Piedraia hortae CBS 480.64 TaxID=1314780 RepID=A0A6A7CAP5_9PEZI|nr:transcription factor Opi1 [Piedraia hortae CBS 480.64]
MMESQRPIQLPALKTLLKSDLQDDARHLPRLESLAWSSPTSRTSPDDDDVRSVAEALVGLGSSVSPKSDSQPEQPLLQLLTQAHPRVGGTINGSMSAYTGAKAYTPPFVQASISLAERNIGSPVVNAVGSVSRMTGAESVARWYLTPKARPGDEAQGGRSKRRKIDEDEEVDWTYIRRGSLPSYGELTSRPPSYHEKASPERRPLAKTWSRNLMVSASGLGVALHECSRHSLTYCLQILSRSAVHISTVSDALKLVLEQYDEARSQHQNDPEPDEASRRLAETIQKHCDDIWQTLKDMVPSVSNSAGGALPSNAREFVRSQLMSLPQRWHRAADGQPGESNSGHAARRMLAFAQECLDMIGQVSQICRATLESAETWVNTAGRRPLPPPAKE